MRKLWIILFIFLLWSTSFSQYTGNCQDSWLNLGDLEPTTGVWISWLTASAGDSKVRWGLASDALTELDSLDESVTTHHISLTGLTAGTTYWYKCETTGIDTQAYAKAFTTFNNDDTLLIGIISDTQIRTDRYGPLFNLMYDYSPDLILHIGDHVEHGYILADWTDEFFPYIDTLISRIPLLSTIGNHDYYQESAAKYKDYFVLPSNGDDELYYSKDVENVHFVSGGEAGAGTDVHLFYDSVQQSWLWADLTASTKNWNILFFHYPVVSSDEGVESIATLLDLYPQISIILSGHHHYMERHERKNIVYLITGSCGAVYDSTGSNLDYAKFTADSLQAFWLLNIHKNKGILRAIQVSDTTTIDSVNYNVKEDFSGRVGF